MAKQLTIDLRTILFIVIEILLIYNYITFPSFLHPQKHILPHSLPRAVSSINSAQTPSQSLSQASQHPSKKQTKHIKRYLPLLRFAGNYFYSPSIYSSIQTTYLQPFPMPYVLVNHHTHFLYHQYLLRHP